MPQGGIDRGEDPRAAALRELLEEVGTDQAELLAESRFWYAYDLAARTDPGALGQALSRAEPEVVRLPLHRHRRGHRHRRPTSRSSSAGAGRRPDEVLHLVVDFKRPIYQAVLEEFGRPAGQ